MRRRKTIMISDNLKNREVWLFFSLMLLVSLIPQSTFADADRVSLTYQPGEIDISYDFGSFHFGEKIRLFGTISDRSNEIPKSLLLEIKNPNNDDESCGFFPIGLLKDGFFIFSMDADLLDAECLLPGTYGTMFYYNNAKSMSSYFIETTKAADNPTNLSNTLATKSIKNLIEKMPGKEGHFLSLYKSDLLLKLENAGEIKHSNEKLEYLEDMFVEILSSPKISDDRMYVLLESIYGENHSESNVYVMLKNIMSYADEQTSSQNQVDRDQYDRLKTLSISVLFYDHVGNITKREQHMDKVQYEIHNKFTNSSYSGITYYDKKFVDTINRSTKILGKQAVESLALSYSSDALRQTRDLENIISFIPQINYINLILQDDDQTLTHLSLEWNDVNDSIVGAQSIGGVTKHKSDIERLYQSAILVQTVRENKLFILHSDSLLAEELERFWKIHDGRLYKLTVDHLMKHKDAIRQFKQITEDILAVEENLKTLKDKFDNPTSLRKYTLEYYGKIRKAQNVEEFSDVLAQYKDALSGFSEQYNRTQNILIATPNPNSSANSIEKNEKPWESIKDPQVRSELQKTYGLLENVQALGIPESVYSAMTILWHSFEAKATTSTLITETPKILSEAKNMNTILTTSSKIEQKYQLVRSSIINPEIEKHWSKFNTDVSQANSFSGILKNISKYDRYFDDLEDHPQILDKYRTEFYELQRQATDNYDLESLEWIEDTLAWIEGYSNKTKKDMSGADIMSVNVKLAKIESALPQIKIKQAIHTSIEQPYKIKKLFQKIHTVEDLVEIGKNSNRFVAGYDDFATSIIDRIDEIENILIFKKDPVYADSALTEILREWQEVTQTYTDNEQHDNKFVYSTSELKKMEYRNLLDKTSDLFSVLQDLDKDEPQYLEFLELKKETQKAIDYGNFNYFQKNLKKLFALLEDSTATHGDQDVKFDVSRDMDGQMWILEGTINQNDKNNREALLLTVHDIQNNNNDDSHEILKLIHTKDGKFSSKWKSPKSGIFAMMLEHNNSTAVKVVDASSYLDFKQNPPELEHERIAKQFQDLENFIMTFGGDNLKRQEHKFDKIMDIISKLLYKNDGKKADRYTKLLEKLTFRYIPERSRDVIVDSHFDVNNQIVILGAIKKSVLVGEKESIEVSILDQHGKTVETHTVLDDGYGFYELTISKPSQSGFYMSHISNSDVLATSIFKIT